MADPNGHHRLPAGAPGRLNLGSASAMINSPRTPGGARAYMRNPAAGDARINNSAPGGALPNMSNPSAGDAMINSSAPGGARPYMRNPSAGDARINNSAPAGAGPHMINPFAGDAMMNNSAPAAGAHPYMINSSALAGAHPHMINPPYAGASSSRLPTASAEWNWDWLHDAMAEQQQQPPPPPRQERSVFFPPTADSFIPSQSLHPVHAPYPSFAPSTYSTIPTVRGEFRPVPYQVPAPHAPASPASYPGALLAAASTAAHTMRGSSLTGTWIPASMGDHKTMMCVIFRRNGRCHDGDGCQFAHHEEEQRIVQGMRGSRWWHQCNEFATSGWCRYGRNCKYSHGHGGV